MMDPEQKLAGAVLLLGIRDALGVSCGRGPHDQSRADIWIRNCGPDFRFICAVAGVDPRFISDAYKSGKIDPEVLRVKRGEDDFQELEFTDEDAA
jgi:hypothetical protein